MWEIKGASSSSPAVRQAVIGCNVHCPQLQVLFQIYIIFKLHKNMVGVAIMLNSGLKNVTPLMSVASLWLCPYETVWCSVHQQIFVMSMKTALDYIFLNLFCTVTFLSVNFWLNFGFCIKCLSNVCHNQLSGFECCNLLKKITVSFFLFAGCGL